MWAAVIRLRRPSWFAVTLTLVGMAMFSSLGVWQLQRASEKQALMDRFAAASTAPVRPMAALPNHVPETRSPHVSVSGRWLVDRIYVLDDQLLRGHRGVQVFAPLRLHADCAAASIDDCPHDTRLLLVGLGFLARAEGPRRLPDLPKLPTGSTRLEGIYAPPPGSGLRLGGNALVRQSEWPKLTTFLDLGQVSADLGHALYPRVLLLDEDPASAYTRVWSLQTIPPARHYGYAFQWFALALAALAIFVVMHRKAPIKKDHA